MTPDEAIKRNLHVGYGRTPLGGSGYRKPREVLLDGSVVVRDSDCEPRRSEEIWTPAKWRDEVKRGGMYRRVGLWSFVRADDTAGDAVAFCHSSPQAAGRALYRAREKVRRLGWIGRLLESAAYQEGFCDSDPDCCGTEQASKRVERIRLWLQ